MPGAGNSYSKELVDVGGVLDTGGRSFEKTLVIRTLNRAE